MFSLGSGFRVLKESKDTQMFGAAEDNPFQRYMDFPRNVSRCVLQLPGLAQMNVAGMRGRGMLRACVDIRPCLGAAKSRNVPYLFLTPDFLQSPSWRCSL